MRAVRMPVDTPYGVATGLTLHGPRHRSVATEPHNSSPSLRMFSMSGVVPLRQTLSGWSCAFISMSRSPRSRPTNPASGANSR